MKLLSQSLLIVLTVSSLFLLVGCSDDKSPSPNPLENTDKELKKDDGKKHVEIESSADQTNAGPVTNPAEPVKTEPINVPEKDIKRVCTTQELDMLKANLLLVQEAQSQISQAKDKKTAAAVQAAQAAMKSCNTLVDRFSVDPCFHKTATGSTKYYNTKNIKLRCVPVENYLIKHNAMPKKDDVVTDQPTTPVKPPAKPPVINEPVVNEPSEPNDPVAPPVDNDTNANLKKCSADEFTKLSQMSTLLTKSDTAIKALGSVANWKYESNAISSASLTTKSCEALIQYHAKNPCEKEVKLADGKMETRQYTQTSLKQRCETSRKYFYEFVQNTKTLMFPNANLFLDMTPFEQKSFASGYLNQLQGCIIENRTENQINYETSKLALLKDTRGFEAKMIVMETAEGLLIQCYGLKIDGPFSKRQIVKVLKEDGSDIRLQYQLK